MERNSRSTPWLMFRSSNCDANEYYIGFEVFIKIMKYLSVTVCLNATMFPNAGLCTDTG